MSTYPVRSASVITYLDDEDTIESATKKARDKGLVVIFPKPDELLVDIDNEDGMRAFNDGIVRLRYVTWVVRPSPSGRTGRYHVTVTMPREVTALERIALQAILGSDRTREILSWQRIQRGISQPTLFFERAPRATSRQGGGR